MTCLSRTVTTSILDWRGIIVRVTFERQRTGDHLTVETIEPQRAPLPLTETGWLSTFLPKGEIAITADPAAYVETRLDHAARASRWANMEIEVRQYALL